MLGPWLFLEERCLRLLVVPAHLRVRGAEVVHSAHIDLARRVLGQVVHDVVSHVFYGPIAAQRNAADRVHADVIQKSYSYAFADVFEDLLRKRRTVRVGVYLGIGVRDRSLFFDVALALDELGSQRVDAFAIVIVALQCVAVRERSCSLKRDAAASVPAHAVLVLDRHDLL